MLNLLKNNYDAIAARRLDLLALGRRIRSIDPNCKSSSSIDECGAHLESRCRIVQAPIAAAAKLAVDELMSGRYARYSSSWKSALRDVVSLGGAKYVTAEDGTG